MFNKASRMKGATSLTIATFFFTFLSGAGIFFELELPSLRPTHEWASVAFSFASIFHVITHKRSFVSYFKIKRYRRIISLFSFIAFVFIYLTRSDIYIAGEVYERVSHLNLSQSSIVLGLNEKILLNQIKKRGVKNEDIKLSLNKLSKKYNFELHEFYEEVFEKDSR